MKPTKEEQQKDFQQIVNNTVGFSLDALHIILGRTSLFSQEEVEQDPNISAAIQSYARLFNMLISGYIDPLVSPVGRANSRQSMSEMLAMQRYQPNVDGPPEGLYIFSGLNTPLAFAHIDGQPDATVDYVNNRLIKIIGGTLKTSNATIKTVSSPKGDIVKMIFFFAVSPNNLNPEGIQEFESIRLGPIGPTEGTKIVA